VTSLVGMSVFAAKNYTSKDLVSLGDALLGRGPVLEGQDVTGDGIVNVFDLIAMRQAMLTTGEFVQSTVPATEENVRYIGRNYYDGETLWLVHSGSAAQFTVSGKSASVTISGGGNENNDEKSRPRYAVIVDGEIILDELIDKAEKTVTLFEGETNRTAKVEVIHLSEANNGAVGLKSVTVDSDALKPVSPTAKKDLTIEFIGDSITCAYGVEGKDQYENFKTSTENFMKSYAYLTAKQLDADYSSVSYSGFGVISGYTSDALNTDSIVPPIYTQIAKSTYTQPWDFESHKSDVVVINLGTNDDTYLSKDFENRCDTYTEGYVDFLGTVRENNPDAYIICTVGTMGCEEVYPLIEKAVAQFTQETGDKKVTSFQSATQNMADGLGSD
ncbi:MAG TPA: GDSL-type esterase/lipase family protein, partial [Ruminococcus sp.]|nr:GDSL-type esterase/lipase family protein [Ruminococcus sp.]